MKKNNPVLPAEILEVPIKPLITAEEAKRVLDDLQFLDALLVQKTTATFPEFTRAGQTIRNMQVLVAMASGQNPAPPTPQ